MFRSFKFSFFPRETSNDYSLQALFLNSFESLASNITVNMSEMILR